MTMLIRVILTGSHNLDQFKCPKGTYSSLEGNENVANCTDCDPGR